MQAYLAFMLMAADVGVPPVDFDTQVIPILTKAGCNSGACHGAAAGRGGFHLSLYGSRPEEDFEEITQALEGRRIYHRDAVQSLFLMKPIEQVSHEGGTRLEVDGDDFGVLRRWISEGAGRRSVRTLTQFDLVGETTNIEIGKPLQLSATATFSDGTAQDVLPWTVLKPDDPSAVEVTDQGQVTVRRTGRHVIVARYLHQVTPLELLVSDQPSLARDEVTGSPHSIDEFINRRLDRLGLQVNGTTNDAEFMRRLSLDLTGRLPESGPLTAFVSDQRTNKRREQVNLLLESEAFTDYWTFHLAEMLRVAGVKENEAAAGAYYRWLRKCVSDDTPFSDMTRQLILSDGSITENGPANFFAVTKDARAQAEFVSRAFLGVRLQCANCHDHPLDAWTQDDYHGLAAIFAGIKRGGVIRITGSGEVIHPATGEAAVAKIPGAGFLQDSGDHRVPLADWLTSGQNPYFARAAVNRIWSRLMGRGLVEPVDDLRVTNPATHPALLDWLALDFVDHDYSLRHTIRKICSSDTYGRSSSGSHQDSAVREFYASANVKPMSPAVFLDAVSDVTGVTDVLSRNVNSRVVSLAGITAPSQALDLLGRCSEEQCDDSNGNGGDLPVQLHLLNGDMLNRRLTDPAGTLMRAVTSGMSTRDLVEDFYLRAYSRRPADAEWEFWNSEFPGTDDRQKWAEVAQDFLWGLLSSEEFRTNR